MSSGAYYNEIDPIAAQWLRNLIAAGHIAPGVVDERDIRLVRPDDVRGFTQCHFFAGIGVWSYALRRAGWQDERPVWTGSCPCQPFSAAGAGGGFDDERHLWPHWFPLIRDGKRRDVPVFGEQVASKVGLAWLDLVHADLEGEGYTVGAVDTCSAGFGAPHIRQRFYFVADAGGERIRAGHGENARAPGSVESEGHQRQRLRPDVRNGDTDAMRLGDASSERREGQRLRLRAGRSQLRGAEVAGRGEVDRLADADGWLEGDGGIQRGWQHGLRAQDSGAGGMADTWMRGCHPRDEPMEGPGSRLGANGQAFGQGAECGRPGPLNGFWRAADWLCCTDGKWRPVEPGTFPLVTGAPGRLGRLRAYGNAINAEAAREFISAYLYVRAAA